MSDLNCFMGLEDGSLSVILPGPHAFVTWHAIMNDWPSCWLVCISWPLPAS